MTAMLHLLLALASEPPAATPPPKVGGPNVVSMFSVDDYPKEALMHGWQGTVVADLTVSADGRVSACDIVQSSDYKVLDDKTCAILLARAKFIPAKDANGRPTTDRIRTPPIAWRIEEPSPGTPSLDDLPQGWRGKAEVVFTVNAQGAVADCRITKSSGNEIVDNATCGMLTQRARFKPARDPYGIPTEDTVSRTIEWRIEDHALHLMGPADVDESLAQLAEVAQNPLAVRHPKGNKALLFEAGDYPAEARKHGWEGSVIADLTVDPQGRVSKCVIVKSSTYSVLDKATCQIMTARAHFYPARDAHGAPVEDVVRTPPINWSL